MVFSRRVGVGEGEDAFMGTTRGQPMGQGVGEEEHPATGTGHGKLGEAGLHHVANGSLILDPFVYLLMCALFY